MDYVIEQQFDARVIYVRHDDKLARVLIDSKLLAVSEDPERFIRREIEAALNA